VTYNVQTALVPVGGAADLECKPGEGIQSEGRLAFVNGKWRGESKGTVTCLGLNEVLRIADATVGHRLESPAVSLKDGHFRQISFDLMLPALSLTDLWQASGSIKWDGRLALDIENSKLNAALALLKLGEVRYQGLKSTGLLELANGVMKGNLALVDPRLDQPSDLYTDARRKWPNLVEIGLNGRLAQKTIDADVTIRSPDWVGPLKESVCFAKAPPEHAFPTFVEKIPICVSLTGGKECPVSFRRREPTIDDYRCGSAGR
jgi:hypothetical protein